MKKITKKPENEKLNFETGEVETIPLPDINVVIIKETKRSNGSVRIQQDFSNCPTLAEQHTAHLTNLNYLIEKYQPDELQQYINARNQYRQEIVNHDFASEPSMQDAKNYVYYSQEAFKKLPEQFRNQFKSHLEFVKFADNPKNAQMLVDRKLVTPEQLQTILISENPLTPTPTPTPPTPTPTPTPTPPTT
nr:MAG: internal scaffolding protein [Microvirus sp.]